MSIAELRPSPWLSRLSHEEGTLCFLRFRLVRSPIPLVNPGGFAAIPGNSRQINLPRFSTTSLLPPPCPLTADPRLPTSAVCPLSPLDGSGRFQLQPDIRTLFEFLKCPALAGELVASRKTGHPSGPVHKYRSVTPENRTVKEMAPTSNWSKNCAPATNSFRPSCKTAIHKRSFSDEAAPCQPFRKDSPDKLRVQKVKIRSIIGRIWGVFGARLLLPKRSASLKLKAKRT